MHDCRLTIPANTVEYDPGVEAGHMQAEAPMIPLTLSAVNRKLAPLRDRVMSEPL